MGLSLAQEIQIGTVYYGNFHVAKLIIQPHSSANGTFTAIRYITE